MNGYFSRGSDSSATDEDQRVGEVSADLAYELQSKMFDQLATVGIAGAGLAVTLIGSLFRGASGDVWFSVVFFGIAAVTAISGNQRLIRNLSKRLPGMQHSKRDVQIAMMLIGMGIGWLSMSVYQETQRDQPPATAVAASGA